MNFGCKKTLFYSFASAFFYLCLVGILGLSMRSAHWITLPTSFQHILHAHSHTALLGWAFTMATSGILYFYPLKWKWLSAFRWLISITIIGMFIAFLYQGYAAISITFSTIYLVLAFIFFARVLKTLPSTDFASTILRHGIYYFYFSTIGIWILGPVAATLGKTHWAYEAGIQFFLHFQINGWLLYAALGLIFKNMPAAYQPAKKWVIWLDVGLLLGLSLVGFWVNESSLFFGVNILSIIALFIGFIPIINKLIQYLNHQKESKQWIIGLVILALLGKLIGHLFNLDYEFTLNLRYNRELIIAYMHLILIGVVSIGFIWNILNLYKNQISSTFRLGFQGFVLGFYITEIILVLQGFRVQGMLNGQELLWFFSLIMLLGIIWMMMAFFFISPKKIGYT